MPPAPGCDGTVFEILKDGSGAEVKKGANVTVHATGVVKETGKKFWSTKDPGQQAFEYVAGVGQVLYSHTHTSRAPLRARTHAPTDAILPSQVIKGWDQGLLGMKLGAPRTHMPCASHTRHYFGVRARARLSEQGLCVRAQARSGR